jgi:hypothetical protein
MSRLLRITLIWLLALALPVQGYAAQANLLRLLNHQASVSTQHAGMTPHQHHADAALQQDGDCCDEHDASAAVHGASTHGKCSSCASSCGAVAITAPVVSVSVNAYASALVATVVQSHHQFLTGGIDRPPRPSLV